METTIAIPLPMDLNALLRGRARGAAICGVFGAAWMVQALFFGAVQNPASFAVVALFAVAFVAWPVTQLRSLGHSTDPSADRQRWEAVSTAYWTNFAIEWLACAVAAIWLAIIRRYDLLPQFLGVIIGVHFLPLAKMFKMPLYYWTGAVMTLGVLATLAIPAGHVRNFAAYSVNGLSLWATAAIILCQDRLSSRMKEGAPQPV
jgi:hypothetical protein